ncbi:MAG: glycosyltransferase [Deltaproteobacteria bacterium]|jgi:chlorobactene glucosyltransferase|nr:glycosyltransferase [Deltaproteobacteria bacterium]
METLIITICGLVTLFGLAITVRCVLAQKRIQWLMPSPASVPFNAKVSVIIPARNEEYDIAPALRSILNQEGVDLEVIVVNDHSTDRTAEIIEHIARTDRRVTALHDPPLLNGWLGKCNAMQHGAQRAGSEFLLFTDADIVHAPNCFATVLNEMQQNAYDFLSLFPRCINRCLWENINIPIYFFGVAKLLATPGLEDPDSPDAVASGALMLIKARVFQEIDGFREVKGEMFDDVGLARLLKARRYRVGYRLAPECVQVQLFKNNRDAFWGNTKNILTAVEDRVWLAVPLMLLAFLQYWTPVLAMVLAVLNPSPLLLIVGFCTYGIQYMGFFTVRRILRFDPLKLLFFPLVAIVGACCISRALYYRARAEITWRGRTIRVHE